MLNNKIYYYKYIYLVLRFYDNDFKYLELLSLSDKYKTN